MNQNKERTSIAAKIKHAIFGAPRNINDPKIFHKLALIPVLAWIGLGADGLSSSSYEPEEAFRAIGSHTYLALFLALGTALTVFIISYAYSRIIEHFPHGGEGILLRPICWGKRAGVISGSALIVDYILTITVSIAACSDAIFSYLPAGLQHLKLTFASFMIILLIILNIRGIKESITGLAPIFITFIVTHALLLGYGIFTHVGEVHNVVSSANQGLSADLKTIGFFGLFLIFIRAYSLGGGTLYRD